MSKGCDFVTYDLNVKIVRALYFNKDKTWNYKGIVYPYNTVYFVIGGNGHIRTNGVTTDMLPGYVYLIPPYASHDIWCDTNVEKVFVDVYVEILPGYDVFLNTSCVLSQEIGLDRCKRLKQLCGGGIREQLLLRGELESVLADFVTSEPTETSTKTASLIPMITYIQQNLSLHLRRDELAERFGWNPSVLSRTFKQAFNCSLKQYIEKLLSARIAEELILTDKTLRRLADEYGFCDAYYLSAYFKRCMGVSPLVFRGKK